ncbi:MAG TPA: hypothetical protein VGH88_15595 [Streptosporangiaceae bacterium]|jgi:hypothetical protein
MQSRYDHDHHHPDSWPAERWLADWWRGLARPRRWAAAATAALAVVLALTGAAAAGGFSGRHAADDAARQRAAARVQAAAGQAGARSPGRARAVARPGGPRRTSCRSVAHIGDSTSLDLISPGTVPDPARRLGAQYRDVGARHVRIDASGGRSVVEEMPRQINGYKVASSYWAAGYRGCWVFALGTNDVANVQAGSAVGLAARIGRMMAAAHGEPVLWVNTRTELSSGPWADPGEHAWDTALASALTRYPNLRIYNWAAVARPAWFLPDGIHYNAAGCAIRARDIAAALARAFPAAGRAVSRIVT